MKVLHLATATAAVVAVAPVLPSFFRIVLGAPALPVVGWGGAVDVWEVFEVIVQVEVFSVCSGTASVRERFT